FFKRDADRLSQDPLLTGPPAEHLADVPDFGFFVAVLAEQEGVLREQDGEWRAGDLPAAGEGGLAPALETLAAALFRLHRRHPQDGWRDDVGGGTPFPSAYLLALLLLARLPPDGWVRPATVEAWLAARHPFWAPDGLRPSRRKPWVETFLLGVAYHLRLVQAARADEGWLVRLAPLGRRLLGLPAEPPPEAAFPRTLLVQPNLEIVAFRQGLTPSLIAKLTRCATWKGLGAACTLQLEPATVYRALEQGLNFDALRLTLEQHATRALPQAVVDALRTWSDK